MEGQYREGDFIKSDPPFYNINSLKINVIGDSDVGKTCMLVTYTTNKFPTEYIPTVFENCFGKIIVDEKEHSLYIWDTAGQEDYERLRHLSYAQTDCFLLCFSIDNRTSYENTFSKWYSQIKRYCPRATILLIGTKSDLRKCSETNCVTLKEAIDMRKNIRAANYLECSALNNEGLSTIFAEVVRNSAKKSSCCFNCTSCEIV